MQNYVNPIYSVPPRHQKCAGGQPQQAFCHLSQVGITWFSNKQHLHSMGNRKCKVNYSSEQWSSRTLDKSLQLCLLSHCTIISGSIENLTRQGLSHPHYPQMAQAILLSTPPTNVIPVHLIFKSFQISWSRKMAWSDIITPMLSSHGIWMGTEPRTFLFWSCENYSH